VGLLIAYILLALGVSFLCSVMEAALLSVTPSFVADLEDRRPRVGARLRALKANIDRPLAAILTLNTLAHTVGAAGAGAQAHAVFGSAWVGVFSGVLTLAILVISEIIPKTLGAVHAKRLAPMLAGLLPPFIALTYPFVLMSQGLRRVLGGGEEQPTLTREEFRALARLVTKEGLFDENESSVLENVLKLRSLRAKDIMTPRTVVQALDETLTVGEAAQLEGKLQFSRLPLFREHLDDVTGYLLKHDLTLELARGQEGTPLTALRRPVATTKSSMAVPRLLEEMLRRREHVIVLVGDYGETEGIVTLEDVVETILGMEIVDETDVVEDMQALARKKWADRAKQRGVDV